MHISIELTKQSYLRHEQVLIVTFSGDKEGPILCYVMVLTLFN